MDRIAQTDMFGPSLNDAKARLMQDALVGTNCPCCKKFVKVYHRKFNSGMAMTMIYTYPWFRSHPLEWLNILNWCAKTHGYVAGEIGKLIWWGMLEKNDAGRYRMTADGFTFVQGRLRVRSHVNEYMSAVQSFDGDSIDIRAALGRKFNYRELMQKAGIWS